MKELTGAASRGRGRWRWLKGALAWAVAPVVNRLLAAFGLFAIHRSGKAIGDLVCMTAAIRDYHARTGARFLVFTRRPEIFQGNPKVAAHFDLSRLGERGLWILNRLLGLAHGPRVMPFVHSLSPGASFEDDMRAAPRGRHLAQIHTVAFPRPLEGPPLPEIVLTAAEVRAHAAALDLPSGFALIQSAGKSSFTPNKEWGPENFQSVVDAMPGTTFLQIGAPEDPPLSGAIDFRGRTATLRELAFVISRASFLVCLEGLYNHLAAAFGVKTFLIQGGFTHPELAAYPTTVVIARRPQVACAPCWLTTPCPIPGKPCTSDISPSTVVGEIRRSFPEAAGPAGAGNRPVPGSVA